MPVFSACLSPFSWVFFLLLCLVGTYTVNNSFLDLYILVGTGLIGYILRKLKFDMAPLILALVLGPIMEKSLRQSLFMARGDMGAIIVRPIPIVLFSVGLAIVVLPPLFRGVEKYLQSRP